MNTPAHAIINLLLFGSRWRCRYPLALVVGAVLPDVPMFVFYAWQKMQGSAERLIWGELYHQPFWQAWFDAFHSFPLLLLGMAASWRLRAPWWTMLLASMLLHALCDFPVHHHDAHGHFFPFSDYHFISPVSYWDPAYYGRWVSAAESLTVLLGGLFLLRRQQEPQLVRRSAAGVLMVYALFWLFAVWMWVE